MSAVLHDCVTLKRTWNLKLKMGIASDQLNPATRGCVVCRHDSDCVVTDGVTENLKSGTSYMLDFRMPETKACDSFDVRCRGLRRMCLQAVVERGLCDSTCLCINAMSVFSAITAQIMNTPAERSLVSHVQWVRQMLDWQVLRILRGIV